MSGPRLPRQIIALGGGGFSMEPDNLTLDRYILAQAHTERPAVAFLPTASGDSDAYVMRFYAAFSGLSCRPSHLYFFHRTPDLRSYLLSQDIVYVGGGNTRSMLGVWREWGLPEILREACEAGVILAGISAGAICWFDQGLTDSSVGDLQPLQCLGFLPGSCVPHYDGEAARRPTYHRLLKTGEMQPGLAIEDGAAVHFVDGGVHRVVASRWEATAYQVRVQNGVVEEEPLPVDPWTDNPPR